MTTSLKVPLSTPHPRSQGSKSEADRVPDAVSEMSSLIQNQKDRATVASKPICSVHLVVSSKGYWILADDSELKLVDRLSYQLLSGYGIITEEHEPTQPLYLVHMLTDHYFFSEL